MIPCNKQKNKKSAAHEREKIYTSELLGNCLRPYRPGSDNCDVCPRRQPKVGWFGQNLNSVYVIMFTMNSSSDDFIQIKLKKFWHIFQVYPHCAKLPVLYLSFPWAVKLWTATTPKPVKISPCCQLLLSQLVIFCKTNTRTCIIHIWYARSIHLWHMAQFLMIFYHFTLHLSQKN